MSNLISLTTSLKSFITVFINILSKVSALERIKEYNDELKGADFEVYRRKYDQRLPFDWPRTGKLELRNLKARYREDLPLALKGISIDIRQGEKIAIVGRTGSGKSTILLALMRVLDVELGVDNQGSVFLDEEDISLIGVEKVREAISIIPQDPILFEGTLKENIDPFGVSCEHEIVDCLQKVGFQNADSGFLRQKVKNRGDNFSIGQRQLVLIAKSLLRRNNLILMDEATANIDKKTDQIIQKVLRENMGMTTVITIAHKLDCISEYDRVVVMEDGEIKEVGSVPELIEKGGIFAAMMDEGV